MDTKLKKWKVVISFLSFAIGASMLIHSLCVLSPLVLDWRNAKDAFQADYQETTEFRDYMSRTLQYFIRWGVSNAQKDSKEPTEAITEDTAINDATKEFSVSSSNVYMGYGDDYLYKQEYQWEQSMDNYQNDPNLLFHISYRYQPLYTKWIGEKSNTPQGYTFLLSFSRGRTEVEKGKERDSIEGGYYTEDSDWYVPGYDNFQVTGIAEDIQVSIAVTETPIPHEFYNDREGYWRESTLYQIAYNQQRRYARNIAALISLIVSILFLSLYWILRSYKKQADLAFAGLTKRIWFEIKLLFLMIAILPVCYKTIPIEWLQALLSNSVPISVYLQELSYRLSDEIEIGAFLFAFWIIYLCINDLRYNKRPWRHYMANKLLHAIKIMESKLPVQKRIIKRFFSTIFLTICMTICVGGLFLFRIGRLYIPFFVILFFIIAIALLLYYIGKQTFRTTTDIGAIIGQIAEIRSGNFDVMLALPEDADLLEAAQNLNDIRAGMHEAIDQQMKSERMKVELIANVSHDIKTPLTSIISYIELLRQEESLPAHVVDYIKVLQNKSDRLKTMVQDVVEVTKAASGQLPTEMELLDFTKLLRQTLADMAERIDMAPVAVRTQIPETPIYIQADGQRMYRVFQNLIQNALQYSLTGSRIYVVLEEHDGVASASVKNISAVELPKEIDFTERFVRGDESRTDGGSGLGLSIASSFTEACGGILHIQIEADLFTAVVEFQIEQNITS